MSSFTTRAYRLPKFTGLDNLTLKEEAVPKLKANEVLVKVHAVSLNFRDLMIANGKYPAPCPEGLVPCSDMAGEIVSLGAEVKGWKEGERVCANFAVDHVYGDMTPAIQNTSLGGAIDGVLTEYKVVPVHSLVRVPAHLSYEEAATLPCAALTAYNALLAPVPLKGGDVVLVQGTGGVSIFGLQLAVASGATVIATSSSDEKLAVTKKLGAHHLINYTKTPKWDDEVMKITGGRGADHIIEVGGAGTIGRSLRAVRMAGVVSTIGFVSQDKEEVNIIGLSVMRAVTIRGILIGSVKQFEDMNRLLEAREIHPVVDKVFAFEEALEAYKYLQSQKHVGKVVIKVAKA